MLRNTFAKNQVDCSNFNIFKLLADQYEQGGHGWGFCLAVASVLLALQADLFSDCLSGRTVTGILPLLQRRRYLMISSSASLLSYRQLVSCPLVVLPVTASRTVLSMQESMVCMDWEVCRFFIADKYRACGLASQQWARLLAQADARAVVMCETK